MKYELIRSLRDGYAMEQGFQDWHTLVLNISSPGDMQSHYDKIGDKYAREFIRQELDGLRNEVMDLLANPNESKFTPGAYSGLRHSKELIDIEILKL